MTTGNTDLGTAVRSQGINVTRSVSFNFHFLIELCNVFHLYSHAPYLYMLNGFASSQLCLLEGICLISCVIL